MYIALDLPLDDVGRMMCQNGVGTCSEEAGTFHLPHFFSPHFGGTERVLPASMRERVTGAA